MKEKYYSPIFRGDSFHCPHCGVYAHQEWFELGAGSSQGRFYRSEYAIEDFSASRCIHCGKFSIWEREKMIYPAGSGPLPSENMPEEVKKDFEEARSIVNASPKGAAALLRLALQKLVKQLGGKGENLNNDIANLVKKGLPEHIQQALDSVRVIGNNAVHPLGRIDLQDNKETAIALFELLNLIVEVMITQPKKIEEIYQKLPQEAREAIKKRNSE